MLGLIGVNVLAVFWTMSRLPYLLRKKIWSWLYKGMKFKESFLLEPIGCSFCCGVWGGLLYVLVTGLSWKMIIVALVMAYFNYLIEDVLRLIKDTLAWIVDHYYHLIG